MRTGILAAVMAAPLAGCAELNLQSALHPSGHDAAVIAEMTWWLIGGATVIFVGVMILLAASLRDGRRPVRPGVWLLGAGVAFPVAVLTVLLVYGLVRSQQLLAPMSQNALVVSVTAKMWWWEVRYRDPATGNDVVTANEIRLPAQRDVYFALTSDDVIHSFWVPSLAGKVDMLRGRITRLRVRTGDPAVLRGQCAEYCGEQHARMALHVVVEEEAAFDAWLANQARPARVPANALQGRGRALFNERRCSACHTIRGVAEETAGGAALGPDLTHVGSRLYLGAGTLRNDGDAMRDWIADVQRIKHGARMPAFRDLDDDSLHALSAYLEHLQ
ncbi:cytochrome c oxidase subunit II [Oxalicibacterium solurbis]|uniref:Cytochrome c oxidase subunit II n=1 Tax=Oxalicibacterium solurbis TaxID=69280 RepID=A0A8J3F4Y3_9BURK|nr:c-type cytochrome [Oxalicibacterium solurbis]GGI54962.1 cytochrome c oxidase subunit II [Oxalicibacterium solurbis]